MNQDQLRAQLRKINSLTKYPSIPTYHKLGEKGMLLEEHNVEFDPVFVGAGSVIATEKVDGTNARIITLPNSRWLIGSREELLHAEGDLIHNPMLGIVDALRDVAARFVSTQYTGVMGNAIITAYLEVYGGNICKASKQYTSDRSYSCRMFDVSVVKLDSQTFERTLEQIAGWRERGGQTFLDESQLQAMADDAGIQLTPRIDLGLGANRIPARIAETNNWLAEVLPQTRVALDDKAGGRPEGIVLRTRNRKSIAKLRFEDYTRHAVKSATAKMQAAKR